MREKFIEYYNENRGKCLGVAAGLVVGILLLVIGFWPTFLLALCVGAGIYFGTRHDKGKSFKVLMEKILPKVFR